MIRLNKYLASCGIASRRKCDQFIMEGMVTINNQLVTEPGTQVNEEKDIVRFKSNFVKPEEKMVYILLNKPAGIVTSVEDEKDRKTVLDLIPDKKRVFPVGRLDLNSSGLLLLTNDGDLTYVLTHPSKEVDKTYRAQLDHELSNEDLKSFKKGIVIDGYKTAPAKIKHLDNKFGENRVEIVIHEGRNRQIRKMMDELGYKVRKLTRIKVGSLSLQGLKPGEWRYLSDEEIKELKRNRK
ncbi:MAG: rRNA pseudouridine synthase [Calditrichia bacterium]|nr:rRNA pseudouridine synthase [Calditrichia bacterium]